jgi:phospholipase/carboxylesterase
LSSGFPPKRSRRNFLRFASVATGGLLARRAMPMTNVSIENSAKEGRLVAQPQSVDEQHETGLQRLTLQRGRDASLYVPKNYSVKTPIPFVLSLHGAGGQAHHGLDLLKEQADRIGLILLAPHSKRSTWDFILGGYGPDVAYIDRALEHVFERYAVDTSRLAIAGFSDGASYALSLGLTNGDLFTHVIAFSPGFMQPTGFNGQPCIYISHGRADTVLPVACSQRIVAKLERLNYNVKHHEFADGHSIPPEVRREAADWFVERGASDNLA